MNALALAALLGPAAAADQGKPDYPFAVKVAGKGKPMILIPGYGCAADVWDSTVAHFQDRYECHALTLAGFAGRPPLPDEVPFTDTVVKGIARYVRDKKLEKPAVVGHSLGAFVMFRLAAAEPGLVGPLIAVDGFPAALALFAPDATEARRREIVDGMRKELAEATPEQFRNADREMFARWLEGKRLETVMGWVSQTDQKTAVKARGELFATDGREGLEKVTSPVLLLGAYHPGLAKYIPTREEFEKRLVKQVDRAKEHRVVVRDNCRHFVMYDAPEWMFAEMEKTLGRK